jgi:hypothetical protein
MNNRPKLLYENIDPIANYLKFKDGFSSEYNLQYVKDNINQDFEIRPYQYNAINRLAMYFDKYRDDNEELGNHQRAFWTALRQPRNGLLPVRP